VEHSFSSSRLELLETANGWRGRRQGYSAPVIRGVQAWRIGATSFHPESSMFGFQTRQVCSQLLYLKAQVPRPFRVPVIRQEEILRFLTSWRRLLAPRRSIVFGIQDNHTRLAMPA
jgi:hypothetical protein